MTFRFRDELLEAILSQPTAPYREGHVIRTITAALEAGKVPHFLDPIGNIIVGAESAKEYQKLLREKTDEPLRLFVAHTDHPGFHGVQWQTDSELKVQWHGGSPVERLEGAKVWLGSSAGFVGLGHLHSPTLKPSGTSLDAAVIRLTEGNRSTLGEAAKLYGGFGFRAPLWREDRVLYTKAADDLVGAFAITSLALDLWSAKKSRKKAPFLGLLTRAEEVGWIGAIGHLQLGWLQKRKRPVIFVSLETSRTLPGAEIGKGPIVRLGDRVTVFDPGALRILTAVAQKALPEKHQRRIMDGGACEATPATIFGVPAIGISIPLGNYHNQSFEGGPDSAGPNGPGPEFVHLDDVAGMITLCHALLEPRLPWNQPWKDKLADLKKSYGRARALLKSGH